MKTKYIIIIISLLVFTSSCKTILQKDKLSKSTQSQIKLETNLNTRTLTNIEEAKNSLIIQHDSLNYWAWIKSSGFFHYHPETGFSGEDGEIWISGNRKLQQTEEQNTTQNKTSTHNSNHKELSNTIAKNKTVEQSQTTKSRKSRWWWMVGAIILIVVVVYRWWRRSWFM